MTSSSAVDKNLPHNMGGDPGDGTTEQGGASSEERSYASVAAGAGNQRAKEATGKVPQQETTSEASAGVNARSEHKSTDPDRDPGVGLPTTTSTASTGSNTASLIHLTHAHATEERVPNDMRLVNEERKVINAVQSIKVRLALLDDLQENLEFKRKLEEFRRVIRGGEATQEGMIR